MAEQNSITEITLDEPIERISNLALESCYLKSPLEVIEGLFEEMPGLIKSVGPAAFPYYVRDKSNLGLNIVYMAQDKLRIVRDEAEASEVAIGSFRNLMRSAA